MRYPHENFGMHSFVLLLQSKIDSTELTFVALRPSFENLFKGILNENLAN